MDSLHNCGKLQIRKSPIEGFGVFATADIKAGEILEEVPFVLFGPSVQLGNSVFEFLNNNGYLSEKQKYIDNLRHNLGFKDPAKYFFKWTAPTPLNGEPLSFLVLPAGNAYVYNSSNSRNNASWQVKEKTFVFKAEKDIPKDTEIVTFFGYFLSEQGQIFNCDQVFGFALDYENGLVKCKAARFGSLEQFHASQQNPSYQRLAQLIGQSTDGLSITKIVGLAPDMSEKAGINLGLDAPMSFLYQKLAEFKNSQFPIVGVSFEFLDKNDGQVKKESIAFKK